MAKVKVFFIFVLISVLSCVSFGSQKIKVLIIDGVNNHDWKSTTIAAKATLEQTGRFTVDVCTSPSRNA